MFIDIEQLSGIVAATLFIFGLKRMSSPVTALSGIKVAGIGMVFAIAAAFLVIAELPAEASGRVFENLMLALLALVVGGGWATWTGRKVQMTGMPQMIALYNGMGGGAAAAIAAAELVQGGIPDMLVSGVMLIGALIGSISLTGSAVAWAKLDGKIEKPWRFAGQRIVNAAVFVASLALGAALVVVPHAGASGHVLAIAFFRIRYFIRHAYDLSDRRGRHAGSYLPLQRLHRACGGTRGLHTSKSCIDDRRYGRRICRHAVDGANGQSDESFSVERAVQ